MNEQEAVKWLKAWSATHQRENINIREAVWSGIKSLKEIQQYRELGTVEELREAREKQIPKKPVKSGVTDSKGIFHPTNGIDGVPYDLCPNCETNLCTTGMLARKKMKYCQECGQKLDWR